MFENCYVEETVTFNIHVLKKDVGKRRNLT